MIRESQPASEQPSDSVNVRVHGHSGTILLNRPAKRNAMTRTMLQLIRQALDDLHQQRSVRAVILTGSGSAFCAGSDVAEIHETNQQENPQSQWFADTLAHKELMETMLRFPKPIIAAVNGPAVGSGAGLVLACDLAVGSPEACFGFPETHRGLVPGIAAPLLAFRLGASVSADLLLRGQLLAAEDCQRLGLYTEVVSNDFVWAKADEIAGEISKTAAEAVAITKRLLNETVGEQLFINLSAGAAAMATARTTEAAAEGVAAFLEKREPNWP